MYTNWWKMAMGIIIFLHKNRNSISRIHHEYNNENKHKYEWE
jgi:cell division protein FtsL